MSDLLHPVCQKCGKTIREQGFTLLCACGRRPSRVSDYPDEPRPEATWYDAVRDAISQEMSRRVIARSCGHVPPLVATVSKKIPPHLATERDRMDMTE